LADEFLVTEWMQKMDGPMERGIDELDR